MKFILELVETEIDWAQYEYVGVAYSGKALNVIDEEAKKIGLCAVQMPFLEDLPDDAILRITRLA